MTPDAGRPGAMSPGAMSPGAVSPGAMSPGAMSPGAMSPGGAVRVFVGMGANVGDRLAALQRALGALADAPGIRVEAV